MKSIIKVGFRAHCTNAQFIKNKSIPCKQRTLTSQFNMDTLSLNHDFSLGIRIAYNCLTHPHIFL